MTAKGQKPLKAYWGLRTTITLYKISAENKAEAKELLQNGTPFAATDKQKGVSTIHYNPPLKPSYEVFEDTNETPS